MSEDFTKIEMPDFDNMEIGKLRQYAKFMQITVPKTATKEVIVEMIKNKRTGKVTPVLADKTDRVPPGHAKIILSEDPTPGHKNFPVYLNANGYECTIPRGVAVIVPMRVVRVLNDAKVVKTKQIENSITGNIEDHKVTVLSYPFQVLDMTPGPEPLSALEISKKKAQAPRRRFKETFGYWPKPGQLTRAIEKGVLNLKEGEELTPEEEAMASRMADRDD